jgi:hypothetical protein
MTGGHGSGAMLTLHRRWSPDAGHQWFGVEDFYGLPYLARIIPGSSFRPEGW